MSDSFDTALAVGSIASIVFVAVCGIGVCLFKDCKQQRKALKQSRSDLDLENLTTTEESSEVRYASPPTPASTTSSRKESSFE
jgi:hypothetical protein